MYVYESHFMLGHVQENCKSDYITTGGAASLVLEGLIDAALSASHTEPRVHLSVPSSFR